MDDDACYGRSVPCQEAGGRDRAEERGRGEIAVKGRKLVEEKRCSWSERVTWCGWEPELFEDQLVMVAGGM